MKIISRILIVLTLLFSVTGCFENPEFKGFSNFQLKEMNKNIIKFKVDVSVFNPNSYNLKIRRSRFDVFVNDTYLGKARLMKKFKMKRKQTSDGQIPVELTLEKGVFFKVLAMAQGSGKVKLRLNGPLKASASIIPVRKKIDETKEIDLGDLNINGMGMLNK
jgi:LEA14-like dessication related protein